MTAQPVSPDDKRHLQLVLGRDPSPLDLERYRRRRTKLLLRQPLAARRRAARIISRL